MNALEEVWRKRSNCIKFFCEKLKETRQSYQSLVAFNSAPVLPQALAKFSPAPSRSQGAVQWFGRTLPLAANASAYSWALASRLQLELKYFWKAAVGTFQVIVLYGDIHRDQLTSIIIYTYTKCQSSLFSCISLDESISRESTKFDCLVTTALSGGHYFYSPVNNKTGEL
jgi:hypothetical protein